MNNIAVIGTGFKDSETKKIPTEILEVKASKFEATLIEPKLPAFPVNEINRHLCETSIIESGLRAAQKNFDGIFINTVGDYGLGALRSALKMPIVGAGQASMHVATQLGRNFSIVTIWPPQLLFIYRGLLKLYKMENNCVSIRCISEDDELESLPQEKNFVTEMRRGEKTQKERILSQCDRAIKEDKADTIILGCTCMSPIARSIAAEFDAPILNPMTTGYKFLELLVDLKLSQSEIEYPQDGLINSNHYAAMADGFLSHISKDAK